MIPTMVEALESHVDDTFNISKDEIDRPLHLHKLLNPSKSSMWSSNVCGVIQLVFHALYLLLIIIK